MSISLLPIPQDEFYSYSAKVHSSAQRSEFTVRNLSKHACFALLKDIYDELETLHLPSVVDQLGYIEQVMV